MQRLTTAQPMDHGTACGLISALVSRYSFLGTAPIGCSECGRKIWGITLGGGKHRVLIAAAFHSTQVLTSLVCLRLCEELCDALVHHRVLNGWDVHRAMIGRTLVFVPMVFPDATYNCTAASPKKQPLEFKKPLFCPEMQALTALCHRCDFRHVITLCGAGEIIEWHNGVHTPTECDLMARVLGAASGYAVSTSAADGDFKDWFVDTFHRPGFCLKLGSDTEGVTVENFDSLYENVREMLLISALL